MVQATEKHTRTDARDGGIRMTVDSGKNGDENMRGTGTLFMLFIFCMTVLAAPCFGNPIAPTELKHYPVDSLAGIITRSGVVLDREINSDGGGSLQITTDVPVTVRLYETGDLDIDNARLIYQARLRTEDVNGQVFLEMWCHFPGKGEFFSRGLQAPLSGTNEWSSQETAFFLQKGENPDNVKVNLVINGRGTVWIDDIRLLKAPLQ